MHMPSITMDLKNLRTNEEGKVLITFDQIVKMPEFPESPIFEIFHGELFVAPSPNIKHQRISGNLYFLLRNHVRSNMGEVFLAPTDVKLSDENLVVPDIFFISKERASIIGEKYIDGAPDLVIEILSTNTQHDLIYKKQIYEEFRVKEYWIVDPENEIILQYLLEDQTYSETKFNFDQKLTSRILPDLIFSVSKSQENRPIRP